MSTESSQRREEILAAALEILANHGHEALTIRRVATAANCSTIGVYTWFGGKDGLVDAILIDGFRSFCQALRKAKRGRGPLGLLMGQGRAYRAWALAHPTSYRVMFMNVVPGHTPSDEAIIAGSESFTILRDEVAACHQRGEVASNDLDAVAMTVWGIVHGLVSIEISRAQPEHLAAQNSLHDRAFDLAFHACGRGLLAVEN
jgi:AcrR family transcriptional regulator